MSNRHLDIGFTEILYGVVVANAIYELTFEVHLRNYMLVLALAFILTDWIEYQIATVDAGGTAQNYVIAFVLDVVILVIWYLLTILSAAQLEWYVAIAGVFFLLQGVWDRLLLGVTGTELLRQASVQLGLCLLIMAALVRYAEASGLTAEFPVDFAATILCIVTVFFLGLKTRTWRALADEQSDNIMQAL